MFTKHTEFVEITVFQKIQFAQLQKVNIHILGYNHFFFFFFFFFKFPIRLIIQFSISRIRIQFLKCSYLV